MNIIYQFSPGRTGSTLVWNILREVFPNKQIKKMHNISKIDKKIVSTIRDPRDILNSRLRIRSSDISKSLINKEIEEMMKIGLTDLLNIKDHANVLILVYEKFYNNYEYIYNKLEAFFNIKISEETRHFINDKYCIDKMKTIANKYKSFYPITGKTYDKNTGIHGQHVSQLNGKLEQWKISIPQKYHNYINEQLSQFIVAFGY